MANKNRTKIDSLGKNRTFREQKKEEVAAKETVMIK